MKLAHIWGARDAFARLSTLKKPPKLAYRLLKYARKFEVELAACEAHRVQCVYEAAGVADGTPGVSLAPDTAEFGAFVTAFSEFLENTADLEPVGVNMDALIEALDTETGNVLSENDLALLEPFFAEPQKPGNES